MPVINICIMCYGDVFVETVQTGVCRPCIVIDCYANTGVDAGVDGGDN
jgi:hypothetical protein